MFGPDGATLAVYDKIHMFDVDLDNGESWRESAAYEPGTEAVVTDIEGARLGFAVCYDLRFPQLFRAEALAGADVLSVPAAFTRQTGEAHWHVLLRGARDRERRLCRRCGARRHVHEDGRETYGHSLIVDPWGRIIAEAAHDEPAVIVAEIDPAQSLAARKKIPNLKNARDFAVNAGSVRSATSPRCGLVIRFSLTCEHEHEFEGWFRSNDDFDTQKKRGFVDCPTCGSHKVEKALMAPAVSTGRKQEKIALAMGEAQKQALVQLKAMAEKVRENADYVGDKFAEEARKIHFGGKRCARHLWRSDAG